MTKVLIFETSYEGHPPQFVEVLARRAMRDYAQHEFVFAVRPDVVAHLPSAVSAALKSGQPPVGLRVIEDAEVEGINMQSVGLPSSIGRLRLAARIAAEVGADSIHFLMIDTVLPALAIGWPMKRPVSGIYFRASTHYAEYWRGLVGTLRQLSKALVLGLVLLRRDVKSLLSLDPKFPIFAKGCFPGADKLHALPETTEHPTGQPHVYIPGEPVRFLLFGALTPRKGIFELLKAVSLLDTESRAQCVIEICGEGDCGDAITDEVNVLRGLGANVEFHRGFLDKDAFNAKLLTCDVVLMPYTAHIGSSSALHFAAGMRKPVLGPNKGLLKEQIVENNLGLTVDTLSPSAIAQAIRDLTDEVRNNVDHHRNYDQFVKGQGMEYFTAMILDTVTVG